MQLLSKSGGVLASQQCMPDEAQRLRARVLWLRKFAPEAVAPHRLPNLAGASDALLKPHLTPEHRWAAAAHRRAEGRCLFRHAIIATLACSQRGMRSCRASHACACAGFGSSV